MAGMPGPVQADAAPAATRAGEPGGPEGVAAGSRRSGGRRSSLRARSAVALAVALVAIVLVAERLPAELGQPRPSTEPSAPAVVDGTPVPTFALDPAPSPGFLVSRDEIAERVRLANAGLEPYASARADLLEFADDALRREPKPEEPLNIKGTEGRFVRDTATAYGLALAWSATGDRAYAEHAAHYLRSWVETTKTTRKTCPDDGSCQTSLIIGRTAPGFVFAADLLRGSDAFSAADEQAFRRWLAEVILPTASRRPNNWGDAGAFMRVAVTDYLDDEAGFQAALAAWSSQLERIDADGHIGDETRRESAGIMYTQEALQYRIGVAVIAERHGVDLWSRKNQHGVTLRDAVDYLARYMKDPDAWPWHDDARVPAPGPFWEIVYARFKDPAWVPFVRESRPYGEEGHSAIRWTTWTNGVPIESGG